MDNGFIIDKEKPKVKGGLPGLESLSPQEQAKHLKQMYKEVFSTAAGKIVLTSILEDLKYFSSCNNEADSVLNNYGKFLISERLGINNDYKIIDAIFSIK